MTMLGYLLLKALYNVVVHVREFGVFVYTVGVTRNIKKFFLVLCA
jgi:hypothetical protein